MASRLPIMRFTKVDFPTFGLPITAIVGSPNKFRCNIHFHIWSTTSCRDNLVESISAASSALARGDNSRVESMASRIVNDSEISLVEIDSFTSFSRRIDLCSISA